MSLMYNLKTNDMASLEKILIEHFNCPQPVFDNNTGGLTKAGKAAYKKLKSLISELADVRVIDKQQVMQALDKMVETHVLVSQIDKLPSELARLQTAVIGKSLYHYSSWSGSSMTIIIDSFEIMDQSILFTGENHWGGRSGIYVDKSHIEELLSTGCAVKHNTIERCDIVTRWTLNDISN